MHSLFIFNNCMILLPLPQLSFLMHTISVVLLLVFIRYACFWKTKKNSFDKIGLLWCISIMLHCLFIFFWEYDWHVFITFSLCTVSVALKKMQHAWNVFIVLEQLCVNLFCYFILNSDFIIFLLLFLLCVVFRIAKTFCFSNRGHGLYLTSPSELQKFTLCADFWYVVHIFLTLFQIQWLLLLLLFTHLLHFEHTLVKVNRNCLMIQEFQWLIFPH